MQRASSLAIVGLLVATTVHPSAQQAASKGLSASSRPAMPRILPGTPASAFEAIQGNALSAASAGLAHSSVRLRDARFGQIVSTQTADRSGAFAFAGIDPGSYVVELVSATQVTLAATPIISVNAGETARVVVRMPGSTSLLAAMLGQRRLAAGSGGPIQLVPAIVDQLPQVIVQAVPAVVPVGSPISER